MRLSVSWHLLFAEQKKIAKFVVIMEQPYIVSARKYRPSTFASVVGQKALAMTLKNAIATGRLAHAYLFCGSRGVGKTSCARIFAKTINCERRTPEGEACNDCESCRQFNEGRSMNIIELDAASNNGVDDMRELTKQVLMPPTTGRYRVFIVDEVHMLSNQAFNAFLKTLEEPPAHAVFILATTEKHKIIPTILSRCQFYDFNRITVGDMVAHLEYVASQEGITADPAALQVIAEKADGAMRDALSIFDQVAASSRGNITYTSAIENLNVLDHNYYSRLMEAFSTGDVPQALLTYKDIRDKGFDSLFFINGLASYMRDLMVARTPSTLPLLDAPDSVKTRMASDSAKFPAEFFYKAMSILGDADLNYRLASNKQFHVELALIRLCQLSSPSPVNSGGGEGQLNKIAPATDGASRGSVDKPSAAGPAKSEIPVAQKPYAVEKSQVPPPVVSAPQPRTVRQAPVPQTSTHSSSGAKLRTSLHSPSFSLRGAVQSDKVDEGESHQAIAPARTARYTDADMAEAWEKFIAAHPTEHVLVNSMRSHLPVRGEGDAWTVTVDSEPQRNVFIDNMMSLLGSIRDSLSNDNVTLTVQLNTGDVAPSVWNEREVLRHITESSDKMRDFIDTFKLTLT